MNLTEEQLKEVETLAGLFINPEDIVLIIGLSREKTEEFIIILEIEKDNPIFKAYHKGRLKATVELRQAIKQAALNGSNPAQISMIEFFNQSRL